MIRAEQIAIFEQSAETNFIRRLGLQLGDLDTSEEIPEFIDSYIRKGLAAARRFAIVKESDVARFLETTWEFFGGIPDFSRDLLAILCAHTTDASEKIDRYVAWLNEEYELPEDDEVENESGD